VIKPIEGEKMKSIIIHEKTIIRFAEEKDAELILQCIKELAEYEKMSSEVIASVKDIQETLFEKSYAEVVICEYDGEPAGFCLFFHNYSTFLGKPGLYIEDLFVKEKFRGKGLGKTLLQFMAKIAVERNCGRLEWSCLDWNKPSIDFYFSQGADAMNEWTVYRVSGEKLKKLAE
jgi:GNAT superfamily N-acetyltransferase